MITCSKCNNSFSVDWREISKDSIAICPKCSNECLVKLFDLQHAPNENQEGFGAVEYNREQNNGNSNTKTYDWHHILTSVAILKFFLILFIIGMFNISFLEDNFPMLAEMYKRINIVHNKGLSIADLGINLIGEGKTMVVNVKIKNDLDAPDLINDVEILVLDPFNNTIAGTIVKPQMIIKELESVDIKINVSPIDDNARKIVIFVNGKTIKTSNIDKIDYAKQVQ